MRALRESLAGEEIHALRGVLNGTTTYVLGRLEQQRPFADAVSDAQREGFAERDPSDDLSGADAAAKLAILCSIAWREPVTLDRVRVRGIDATVSRDDRRRARVRRARPPRRVGRSATATSTRRSNRKCSTAPIRSPPAPARTTSSRSAPHWPVRSRGTAQAPAVAPPRPHSSPTPSPPREPSVAPDRIIPRWSSPMTASLLAPTGQHGTDHAAAFTALSLVCDNCGARFDPEPSAICLTCLGPLVPVYDPNRSLPNRAEIHGRTQSLWRYREWLPFDGTPTLSPDSGFTPLVEVPELARRLGVARAWVKNDAVSHPTLSFKDRVVSTAINAAHAFGLDVIGCASTGNLANAVAAHAARAGEPAWIFIPHDLEPAKVLATAIFAPKLVRVRGTYDDVNRLCAQVADSFGWGVVNVNLRAYYGEGSKTMAFEIIEQLGWRAPTAVVAPMAGGALVTKLHRGFREFAGAGLFDDALPRLYGAQAEGCAPIVRLVERGERPDRAGDPVDDRPVARHRQPGRRPDRRTRHRGHGRLGGGSERCRPRRRHPPARRDDRDLRRDGGRRHDRRSRCTWRKPDASARRTKSSSA